MIISSRFTSTAIRAIRVAERSFSSECAPAQKLRNVFEEYRRENYSRETPQRFRKELVKAAQTSEGMVQVDRLNDILVNIGRSDQLLSEEELVALLTDAGVSSDATRSLPASKMMQLM